MSSGAVKRSRVGWHKSNHPISKLHVFDRSETCEFAVGTRRTRGGDLEGLRSSPTPFACAVCTLSLSDPPHGEELLFEKVIRLELA